MAKAMAAIKSAEARKSTSYKEDDPQRGKTYRINFIKLQTLPIGSKYIKCMGNENKELGTLRVCLFTL